MTWWILDAAVISLPSSVPREARTKRPVFAALATVLGFSVFWNVAVAALQFAGFHAFPHAGIIPRYTFLQPLPRDMQAIAANLPDDAIVIGHPGLLWPLPTFRGKVVSVEHANPMVPDEAQRRADVVTFLDPASTQEQRRCILFQYRVTHILYNRGWQREAASDLDRLGDPLFTLKGYVLLTVRDPSNSSCG